MPKYPSAHPSQRFLLLLSFRRVCLFLRVDFLNGHRSGAESRYLQSRIQHGGISTQLQPRRLRELVQGRACAHDRGSATDPVEMIRFVTFATCQRHHKRLSVSGQSPTCRRPMHSTLPPVALLRVWPRQQCKVVGVVDRTRCQAGSDIQQRIFWAVQACNHENPLGPAYHVYEPTLRLLQLLATNGTREVYRDHLLHRAAASGRCSRNRLRGKLTADCRRERVDTDRVAALVPLARRKPLWGVLVELLVVFLKPGPPRHTSGAKFQVAQGHIPTP